MEENQVQAEKEAQIYSVPWSVGDTWLGVVLLILLSVGMLVAVFMGINAQFMQNIGVLFLEMIYILPVALIFLWRRIHWKYLGFGKFTLNVIGIGCGLLIGGYAIIIAHNALLYAFGIDAQGDQIFEIFNQLDSPIWFFVTGAVIAPIVEEIFFRGFLFQGFRQRYGWAPALLLSSAIFSAAHLDPASLLPTFILGLILTYVYHRSNSLWPGIIIHFLINASSSLLIYLITKLPGFIPS